MCSLQSKFRRTSSGQLTPPRVLLCEWQGAYLIPQFTWSFLIALRCYCCSVLPWSSLPPPQQHPPVCSFYGPQWGGLLFISCNVKVDHYQGMNTWRTENDAKPASLVLSQSCSTSCGKLWCPVKLLSSGKWRAVLNATYRVILYSQHQLTTISLKHTTCV